jgi:hypothetical protein
VIKFIIIFLSLFAFIIITYQDVFASSFTQLTVPLTKNKLQFDPANEITFHLDNKTSNAIEVLSNVTGQNKTIYLKYDINNNLVVLSNSSLYIDYTLQLSNAKENLDNRVSILRYTYPFVIQYISNFDNFKFKGYYANSGTVSVYISVPNDMENYQTVLKIYIIQDIIRNDISYVAGSQKYNN